MISFLQCTGRLFIFATVLLSAPNHILAEEGTASSLSTVIEGSIDAVGEVDLYSFEAQTGDKITLSAYFGKTDSGSVLGRFGKLRLIGPDGSSISTPANREEFSHTIQKCYVQYGTLFCGFESQFHIYTTLDEFVLPETGTYRVEVTHSGNGIGKYWLGISNPEELANPFPQAGKIEEKFGVRGDREKWELIAEEGSALGWIYRGVRGLRDYAIFDGDDTKEVPGIHGTPSSIIFTPERSGLHRLSFTHEAPSILRSPADIGPFDYTLTPAMKITPNTVIEGDDGLGLFAFTGKAGQEVTLTAYFGETDSGAVLGRLGRMRLLDANGTELGAPEKRETFSHMAQVCYVQYGTLFCGFVQQFDIVNTLDAFVLPETGTYFIEIVHTENGVGKYWLTIGEALHSRPNLPLQERTNASFSVRGEAQEWEFFAGSGHMLGWTYEGRRLSSWKIIDPLGTEVTSGGGTSEDTISFTPGANGIHQLILHDDPMLLPTDPDQMGPFHYSLIPFETNALPFDIAMENASLSDPTHLTFSYETIGVTEKFPVFLYRSRDPKLNSTDDLLIQELMVTPAGGSGETTVELPRPDPLRPFVLIVADPPENPLSEDPGVLPESDEGNNVAIFEQDLLTWFSPILHIFEDDFVPKEVESMVGESIFHFDDGITFPAPATIDIIADEARKESEYMDMRDARPGTSPIIPPTSRFEKYRTAVYGRSFVANSGQGNVENLERLQDNHDYRVLQYWFFYPYNNFVYRDIHGNDQPGNNHEGDWEMIQLILDPITSNPLYATYSWHWGGSTFRWPEDLLLIGDHPRVFVGKGGHASWNEGGVNFFRLSNELGGLVTKRVRRGDLTPTIGDTESTLLFSQDSAVSCTSSCSSYYLLSVPTEINSNIDDWNRFPGKWGELGSTFGDSGPNSPRYVQYGEAPLRWELPISWSNDPTPSGWDVTANSPINLSIFDSSGNQVGVLPSGEAKIGIPGTYFFSSSDDGPEWATILTKDLLTFDLEGTGKGTMDLSISRFGSGIPEPIQKNFDDVPISPSFLGTVSFSEDLTDVLLEIDQNGDGEVDGFWLPGGFASLKDLILALPDRAFVERESNLPKIWNHRKELLKKVKEMERKIEEGKYLAALLKLKNDIAKKVDRWLVQVEPEEGEASKRDVEGAVLLLMKYLEELK